jgi:hypothetical protein
MKNYSGVYLGFFCYLRNQYFYPEILLNHGWYMEIGMTFSQHLRLTMQAIILGEVA